jgi:carboxyl-terminal processing protease
LTDSPPPRPSTASPAQIEKYLTDALALIRSNALFSDTVDWDTVGQQATETTAQAHGYPGTHRLLSSVVKQAGGRHSRLIPPYPVPRPDRQGTAADDQARKADGQEAAAGQERSVGRADAAAGPLLPAARIIDGVGYISLPPLPGGAQLARRYVTVGSKQIDAAATAQPRGWIVDLRDNTGGDMWPMLAVVAGLLHRGVLGYFARPDHRMQAWSLNRWFVSLGRRPMARARARGRFLRPDQSPVAVLTSSRTASAAEAVLLALRSQSPVRTIGAPTAGMTTANHTHLLRDGSRLMISEAYYADAGRQLITGPIGPDQRAGQDGGGDALAAALEWIATGR